MKLFEYEGKQLFNHYHIPIPNGWLSEERLNVFHKPVVVKAQVLSGGRGKKGGIIKADTEDEILQAIDKLSNLKINKEQVSHIYIEEKVAFIEEFYLSIVIDRNQKGPVLIASREGGIDIEAVPKEKVLNIPINPLIGIQSYMITKVAIFLQTSKKEVENLIYKVWSLFTEQQAHLVEINPLFLTKEDAFIAGDAKIILDEDANNRQNITPLLPREQDNYESNISQIGAVGVEMEGDISVITSGAGLGIATIDLVKSRKGTIRSFIDLGGNVFSDKLLMKELIAETEKLEPKKFLFNFYFQLASCLPLTESIAASLGGKDIPVYVRLKGVDETEANELLKKYDNIFVTNSLLKMTEEVVK